MFRPWPAPWPQAINQALSANMATEPHSAKRSVALFATKPKVFLNAATIRQQQSHWSDCCSGWRLFTEGMFAYCSCSPPDVDRGPICSSVRSLTTESQVLSATRDGTQKETCLRRALILKIHKSGGFCLLSKLSVLRRLSLQKNYVLDCFACGPRPVQGVPLTD